jgi:hypothetical protein
MCWACEEVRSSGLADPRLALRLQRMLEDFAEHPEASCTEALGRAGVKAAYRFWDNPRVEAEEILAGHVEQCVQRSMNYPVVLVAQDTTEIDQSGHPATKGMGYLGSPTGRGMFLHSLLGISPAGVPLGVLHQFAWTRPLEQLGKRHERRKKPLSEKESQRWLGGLAAVSEHLREHPHVVLVGDRESDIFDLFAAERPANVDLLVRVCREKRRVEHPAKYLDAALESAPVRGYVQIEIPARSNRRGRTAVLAVRWQLLDVHAPSHGPKRPSLPLSFILVEESDPPEGETPIRWLLVTTMTVANLEDALRYVQWYAYRWTIERFHFVLKSGYKIEERQLESVERMERAIPVFSIVAWRLLWLSLQARETPNAPCTMILSEAEWQVLHAAVHGREVPLPTTPPTLRESIRSIARLGGFLGRKCDGEPGPRTLWRGVRRLHDLTQGWLLAQSRNTIPAPLLPVLPHARQPC